MKKTIAFSFVILLASILTGCAENPRLSTAYDDFASCLTENGAKMYGTEWCSHCQDQKAMFGASFSKVNYIDCDLKRLECKIADISGYPTWVFADGSKISGAQRLETLADKTGCVLPE